MNDLAPNRAYEAGYSASTDELETILADMGRLRQLIVQAWQTRGLSLDREERHRLRDEIRSTCEMLTTLTASE